MTRSNRRRSRTILGAPWGERLILLASLLALPLFAGAQPAGKKVTIAIYAPNAPFASGTDRFNFVNRLAQQVSSVAGVSAEAKAFGRAGDFESAVKNKQVDFAVVDGVYLAQRGVPWQVLAIATSGGETQPKWGLFSNTVTEVSQLKDKRLGLASTGPRDDDFIGNALFDGEVQVKKFFSGKNASPDIASAVQAVSLHKADAVFAPESAGSGLKKVFDAGRVPNAAFCEVGSGLANDLVSKVKNAVVAHGAAAALDGWKSSDAGPFRTLHANMNARSRKPIMAEPDVIKMEDLDVLVPPQLETALPDLKSQYWNPNP